MCAGLTPDAGDGACETRDYVQQQRTPITKSEGFVIIKGGGGGGGGGLTGELVPNLLPVSVDPSTLGSP